MRAMDEMRLYYLVERAVDGALSAAEQAELDLWLAESDANRIEFAEIKEILGFGRLALEAVAPETNAQWAAMQTTIATPTVLNSNVVRPPFWSGSRVWAAAAAVLLLMTVGGYFAFFGGGEAAGKAIHFATKAGERKEIKLSDGSLVTLQGETTLDANGAFGEKDRQLQLNGEAYFAVAKDKTRPFIVRAGLTNAEALGTEFNVRMYQNNAQAVVQLSVTEGTVKFSADNGAELVLNAGEVANFDPAEGTIQREKASANVVAAWKSNQLIFSNTPFVEAALRLESHYGVTLQFPDTLNRARLTATFDNKPLSEVLGVLEDVYSLKASQSGTVVTLSE